MAISAIRMNSWASLGFPIFNRAIDVITLTASIKSRLRGTFRSSPAVIF
jgi:hypothetical protein